MRNWGYWLSSFAIDDVVAAPHDLMVVDSGVSANRRFIRPACSPFDPVSR